LTWVGFALVNVHLTAPSLETGQAVASVRAWHIHAGSTMFTRRAYKRGKNVKKRQEQVHLLIGPVYDSWQDKERTSFTTFTNLGTDYVHQLTHVIIDGASVQN
jgi:hypothetical protein